MKQTGFCELRGSSFPYLVLPPVACYQSSEEEGKGAKRRDKIRGFFPPLSFPIRACHAGYSQPTPSPLSAFSPDSLTTRQSATPRRIGPNCKQLKIIKGIPPNNWLVLKWFLHHINANCKQSSVVITLQNLLYHFFLPYTLPENRKSPRRNSFIEY